MLCHNRSTQADFYLRPCCVGGFNAADRGGGILIVYYAMRQAARSEGVDGNAHIRAEDGGARSSAGCSCSTGCRGE
jgi:hypothetical protein